MGSTILSELIQYRVDGEGGEMTLHGLSIPPLWLVLKESFVSCPGSPSLLLMKKTEIQMVKSFARWLDFGLALGYVRAFIRY